MQTVQLALSIHWNTVNSIYGVIGHVFAGYFCSFLWREAFQHVYQGQVTIVHRTHFLAYRNEWGYTCMSEAFCALGSHKDLCMGASVSTWDFLNVHTLHWEGGNITCSSPLLIAEPPCIGVRRMLVQVAIYSMSIRIPEELRIKSNIFRLGVTVLTVIDCICHASIKGEGDHVQSVLKCPFQTLLIFSW